MIPENWLEILIRLVLALFLGGVIGIERAYTNHDAGLRTHILVCMGASGIMIMSEMLYGTFGGDIGRIGAQVVSGIGFLGTGCILIGGSRIRGLTTAAGLWTTACIGLCVGIGYYYIGVLMAVLMVIAMVVLHPLSEKLQKRELLGNHILKIAMTNRDAIKSITSSILDSEGRITSISFEDDSVCVVKISSLSKETLSRFVSAVLENEYIISVDIVK